jgi:hypothetical protein
MDTEPEPVLITDQACLMYDQLHCYLADAWCLFCISTAAWAVGTLGPVGSSMFVLWPKRIRATANRPVVLTQPVLSPGWHLHCMDLCQQLSCAHCTMQCCDLCATIRHAGLQASP